MFKLGILLTLGFAPACGDGTAQNSTDSSYADGSSATEMAAAQDPAPAETPKPADQQKGDEAKKEDAAKKTDGSGKAMPTPAQKAVSAFIAEQTIDKSAQNWRLNLPKPPVATFDKEESYFWVLDTSLGTIKIRLMPDVAPMHVTSTMYLTELGFYDGLIFHRVINGFMAQGGCPLGKGMGGPGYKYAGEFDPKVKHDRPGLLSMANAGPGTDGSQFFLTFVPTSWLDGKHTLFGEVVEGMDVLKAMEKRGSRSGTPSEEITLQKATIVTE